MKTVTYEEISVYAAIVDDLERTRIANANRYASLTRPAGQEDEAGRPGVGLEVEHPSVRALGAMIAQAEDLERQAIRRLEAMMKLHPLGDWQRRTRGVGAKQLGRLLGATGDPYVSRKTGQPRESVRQLWAYCGLHTTKNEDGSCSAARRRRGERANWSNSAKMRAYLIAVSCLKQRAGTCANVLTHLDGCKCSPYRVVYDERRREVALSGRGWTDGHAHNDALRMAAKAILNDLYEEAKLIYEKGQSNAG